MNKYLISAYLTQLVLLVVGVFLSFMKEAAGLIIVGMSILLFGLIQLAIYMKEEEQKKTETLKSQKNEDV